MQLIQKFKKEWQNKSSKQKIYMGLGFLFLLFALVGLFLPVFPQVPFAIISAFFFSKGSRKMHEWVRSNKYFGRHVQNWEDDRVVETKLKVISTLMMIGGAGIGHWRLPLPWALVLDAIFFGCIVFLLTRKTPKSSQEVIPRGHEKFI